jgi:hypothetical protein
MIRVAAVALDHLERAQGPGLATRMPDHQLAVSPLRGRSNDHRGRPNADDIAKAEPIQAEALVASTAIVFLDLLGEP